MGGFKDLKLGKIIAFTFPDNVASWRALEKIGMQYVGLARYPDVGVDVKKYIANLETRSLPKSQI
jgi:RimJ/RimL family protein N-acetyltransferase